MNILTHNIHSGYDAELAKTGHDFFSTSAFKAWDPDLRKLPPNWHQIVEPGETKYDAILISHDFGLAKKYASIDAPMIFNIIADCSEGIFPGEIEDRCAVVSFLAKEVAERWELKDPSKKRVIEMGVDTAQFFKRTGDIEGALTVGHRIGKRWDKGHCPFVTVRQFIPLTLVGPGNEEIPGSVGTVSHGKLMEMYSRYRMYFNPGPIIGISVAEAMLAGMPVVAFRPINLCGLIVNGLNGFVVDTVDGAMMRIHTLLRDPDLAMKMGEAARKSAEECFNLGRFLNRWNALFDGVAAKRPAQVS